MWELEIFEILSCFLVFEKFDNALSNRFLQYKIPKNYSGFLCFKPPCFNTVEMLLVETFDF